MSEEIYDREIAPALLDLANRCKEAGMPFTATVEYVPGERGTTAAGIADDNFDMLVPYMGGRLGGKLDDLLIFLARRLRELGKPHSCICLQFFIAGDPKDRLS